MKARLLRRVRENAKEWCHLNSITTTTTAFRSYVSGYSIGYATEEARAMCAGIMDIYTTEEEFNRKVSHKYWEVKKYLYCKKNRK